MGVETHARISVCLGLPPFGVLGWPSLAHRFPASQRSSLRSGVRVLRSVLAVPECTGLGWPVGIWTAHSTVERVMSRLWTRDMLLHVLGLLHPVARWRLFLIRLPAGIGRKLYSALPCGKLIGSLGGLKSAVVPL
jgi:hypothetical protein